MEPDDTDRTPGEETTLEATLPAGLTLDVHTGVLSGYVRFNPDNPNRRRIWMGCRSLSATGLPAGLRINGGTDMISGTLEPRPDGA